MIVCFVCLFYLFVCLVGWLVVWLVGWLFGWLVGRLVFIKPPILQVPFGCQGRVHEADTQIDPSFISEGLRPKEAEDC